MTKVFPLILLMILFSACDNPKEINMEEPDTSVELSIHGSGDFTFTAYDPLSSKPVQVYYHIPEKANSQSPVLMVFTGSGRDAKESRDVLVNKSDQLKFTSFTAFNSLSFSRAGCYLSYGWPWWPSKPRLEVP